MLADRGGEPGVAEQLARPATGGRCAARTRRTPASTATPPSDRAPDAGPAEAVLAAVDDAVDERDQADDGQQHAEHVDAARAAGHATRAPGAATSTRPISTTGTLIRKTEPHQKCSSSAPPSDRADRHGEADRAGPDADRPAALARVEDVGDDRQRHRHDRRAADAHERAGRDELAGVLRVRREQRGQAEQHQADQQEALAADAVAEHAEGEQQPGEDQGVRVDRPLQLALGRAEAVHRVGERAQRHVEDGVVEHDHEQADHQHPEDRPPPRVSGVVVQLHAWLSPHADHPRRNTIRVRLVTRVSLRRALTIRHRSVSYVVGVTPGRDRQAGVDAPPSTCRDGPPAAERLDPARPRAVHPKDAGSPGRSAPGGTRGR